MPDVADLVWRVHHALADSPYTVVPTAAGFDVVIDLRGAAVWGGTLTSMRESWIHHVELDAATGEFRITDERREVRWHAGTGHFGASLGVQKGWIRVRSFGVGTAGRSWSFDSHEGRRLVADAARTAGWRERLNRHAKIGVVTAVACGGFAVLLLVVLGVIALAGGFATG